MTCTIQAAWLDSPKAPTDATFRGAGHRLALCTTVINLEENRVPAAMTPCILCVPLPVTLRPGSLADRLQIMRRCEAEATPLTWYGGPESLAALGEAGCASCALEIGTAEARSGRDLRRAIASARRAVPTLQAAIFTGQGPFLHRDLLIDSGITVLGLDRFDAHDRRSRRPAPRRWPCRSVAWGLWEVAAESAASRSWLRLLGRSGDHRLLWRAALPPGDDLPRRELDRMRRWARHRIAGGRVRGMLLADLPEAIRGQQDDRLQGSILRAA